jgi:hypothetical protein
LRLRWCRWTLPALLLAGPVALSLAAAPLLSTLGAQGTATAALERAIEAYRNLDYDAAAAQLEALVADRTDGGPPRLSEGARVRALMYLGATEYFRERRPAAAASFTRLLLLDPGYRPDQLIFPPEVSSHFDEVRRGVRAVGVIVADSVEIRAAADGLPLRLHASTPHDVRVMVVDARGSPVRLLHDGEMGDSIDLRWSGRDGSGRLHASGAYSIEVVSRAAGGSAPRTVLVPLRLDRLVPDTVVPPPATFVRRPETRRGERKVRPAIVGVVGAVLVAALPSVIGEDSDGMPVRFAVAGALAIGGASGLLASIRPQPIPANVEWNRQQTEAWQREVARAQAENTARRQAERLRIFAERPRVSGPP